MTVMGLDWLTQWSTFSRDFSRNGKFTIQHIQKSSLKLNTRIILLFFVLTWLLNFTHQILANLSYLIFTETLCTFIQHDLTWSNLRITNNRIKTFFRHNQITLSICNKIAPHSLLPFPKNYIKKLYYFCLLLLLIFLFFYYYYFLIYFYFNIWYKYVISYINISCIYVESTIENLDGSFYKTGNFNPRRIRTDPETFFKKTLILL